MQPCHGKATGGLSPHTPVSAWKASLSQKVQFCGAGAFLSRFQQPARQSQKSPLSQLQVNASLPKLLAVFGCSWTCAAAPHAPFVQHSSLCSCLSFRWMCCKTNRWTCCPSRRPSCFGHTPLVWYLRLASGTWISPKPGCLLALLLFSRSTQAPAPMAGMLMNQWPAKEIPLVGMFLSRQPHTPANLLRRMPQPCPVFCILHNRVHLPCHFAPLWPRFQSRPQLLRTLVSQTGALLPWVSKTMHDLRLKLHAWLLEAKVPCRLHALLEGKELEALFSLQEVAHARSLFSSWMVAKGCKEQISWDIPSGQPYALHALSALSKCLGDRDTALFPALLAGAPTGFDNDIPASGCLLPAPPAEHAFALDLAICQGNWQGAESDPASLQELIQAEEDAGFAREFPSLEAAQAHFGPDRVAVGRVNIAHTPGKKTAWLWILRCATQTRRAECLRSLHCLRLGILELLFRFGKTMRRCQAFPLTSVPLTKLRAFVSRTRVSSASASRNVYCFTRWPPLALSSLATGFPE